MQPLRSHTDLIELPSGATVSLEDRAVVARNPEGRVILRFDGHTVELVAAADLALSAPDGGVAIRARDAVVIEGGTIEQRAERHASIAVGDASLALGRSSLLARAPEISARADEATLASETATVVAQRIATTAQHLVQEVERVELRAGKIIERAGDVARHASGLCQLTARRLRTLVEGSYALVSERTSLRSRQETTIDGDKILLG